jgi:hypothetical protein
MAGFRAGARVTKPAARAVAKTRDAANVALCATDGDLTSVADMEGCGFSEPPKTSRNRTFTGAALSGSEKREGAQTADAAERPLSLLN